MNDCIFCKIISQELPSTKVYEDEDVVAFKDISPKAPVHVLVLPKKHIVSLADVEDGDGDLMGKTIIALSKVAKELGIDTGGFKVVVNNGEGAGQLVFHLHFHLLGGWKGKEKGWKV